MTPLPLTEEKLIKFVAYTVNYGLKYQTNLSAVRHFQVTCGWDDPRV